MSMIALTEPGGANEIVVSADDALALSERVMRRAGYSEDESRIIAANLLDAELCGYPALGLARLITIAEDPRTRQPRNPVSVVHGTPVSALIDGGNYVGLYALHRAAEIAIEKARASRFALVGVHNSYLSGRNARYVEMIARAGFVCIHTACSEPYVVPLGGKVSAFGTNPIAFGLPGDPDPLIFDMGTSAITHSEVVLASRLSEPLPEGVAVDAQGLPTRDAAAALAGGILPFGGHKGYGLSLMIQALGLAAGAALPRGRVQDFGFLFVVFDPGLLVPPEQFKQLLAELIRQVKSTPRQPGVEEIRIPSQRAFQERRRRCLEGMVLERRLYDSIIALAA
jgi:LDH2 family malate/lactate/ureidoglycolate dehydrogenase